jgi:hypothetical protein
VSHGLGLLRRPLGRAADEALSNSTWETVMADTGLTGFGRPSARSCHSLLLAAWQLPTQAGIPDKVC